VGISNPDPKLTGEDPADPGRSAPENNPFTYYERYRMVRAALMENGVPLEDFSTVPFPVNHPGLLRHYVPLEAVFYLTIYDDWGRKKLSLFESLGLRCEVLWEKPPKDKGISATDLRKRIVRGQAWESMVPGSVRVLLREWNLEERLQNVRRA
jgi:nicotinamide-nucleotide adenylyltransferase